ncbi:hypothetical protein DXG01_006266, partial [Tephrocybe rancida]
MEEGASDPTAKHHHDRNETPSPDFFRCTGKRPRCDSPNRMPIISASPWMTHLEENLRVVRQLLLEERIKHRDQVKILECKVVAFEARTKGDDSAVSHNELLEVQCELSKVQAAKTNVFLDLNQRVHEEQAVVFQTQEELRTSQNQLHLAQTSITTLANTLSILSSDKTLDASIQELSDEVQRLQGEKLDCERICMEDEASEEEWKKREAEWNLIKSLDHASSYNAIVRHEDCKVEFEANVLTCVIECVGLIRVFQHERDELLRKIKELEANTKEMENLDGYIVELEADKAQMQIDLSNFKASAEKSHQESQTALEKYRQDNKNLGKENQR